MNTLCLILIGQVFGPTIAPPASVFGSPAESPQVASVFGEAPVSRSMVIPAKAVFRIADADQAPTIPAEIAEYTPLVIGTTADGAIANYEEARRMAANFKGSLVVVVGQTTERVRDEEARSDAARVVVCDLDRSDAFAPGVYHFTFRDGDLYPVGEAYASDAKGRLTPRAATPTASTGAGGLSAGSCANGQCGVPATTRRFFRGN